MTIRTRFAPSPTGYLHIGGARTALFSWLFARKHGGQFVLRIEDTDQARSTKESINAIIDGMDWLGLDYDEGPFYQTQRYDRYRKVMEQLLKDGHAYHCYCSKERLEQLRTEQMAKKIKPRYDGHCRDRKEPAPESIMPVVRFKNPLDGETIVTDLIKGHTRFNNAELDDLIIWRSDDHPTYNFTVVVDDVDMRITHVIRGDDHLNNTPRQINIFAALGAPMPHYAHVPLILATDGARLSKRHGAVSVLQFRDEGYLPDALINYLARLGWSHGDQEIFTREEMISLFEIEKVHGSAATYDANKLLWYNQHYLQNNAPKQIALHLKPLLKNAGIDATNGPALEELIKVQQTRAKTLEDMALSSRYFYEEPTQYDTKDAVKHLTADALPVLEELRTQFAALNDWQAEPLHDIVKNTAEKLGLKLGKVAQPLRVALMGRAISPSIDVTLMLISKDRVLARLDRAIGYTKNMG